MNVEVVLEEEVGEVVKWVGVVSWYAMWHPPQLNVKPHGILLAIVEVLTEEGYFCTGFITSG